MNRSFFPGLLFPVLLFSAPLRGEDIAVWHRDYPSALQEAKAESKDLMIVFTGTDWIEICGKFYDDILSQPSFMEAMSSRFVLLKLEYPRDGKLPKEEAAQKSFLRAAYQAKGFPTVVLTDVEARPFGVNGFQPLPPAEYAAQILSMEEAHEARRALAEEAGSLAGLEKAKKLVESIPELPGILTARFYRKEMAEILEADPGDTLKLKEKYLRLIADADYSARLQVLTSEGKWKEMIQLTDQYIAEGKLEGEVLQRALMNKAAVQRQLEDAPGFVATLQEVIQISAETETGSAAKDQLDRLSRGSAPSREPEKN
jgi:thioredoxin-related protein